MTQRDHFYLAHRRMMEKLHTFVEIQNGPNPLTLADMRALVAKRPGVYAFLVSTITRLEREQDAKGL